MMDYHLLPQFMPARLQDLVLWYEPWSFRGRTWRNLAPNYSDRNHGTAHGGVGLSSWHPRFSPAPTFYGNDDYVELPSHITTAKTQEGWFYFTQLASAEGSWKYLFNNLYQHSINNYLYFIGTHDYFAWVPSSNTWYHIVITYTDPSNTNTAKLYINGAYTKSISQQSGEHDIDSIYRISSPSSNSFNGIILLVRVYKAALTPAEVMHNYTHHPLYYLQRGIDPYMFVKRGGIYYVM